MKPIHLVLPKGKKLRLLKEESMTRKMLILISRKIKVKEQVSLKLKYDIENFRDNLG